MSSPVQCVKNKKYCVRFGSICDESLPTLSAAGPQIASEERLSIGKAAIASDCSRFAGSLLDIAACTDIRV
jgi:hypothetical protein